MQTFSRAGLTFDVADSGTPDNGTVVLLHGFPQTSHSWRKVTPILNEQGYRTIAPDQRGYSPLARPRGRFAYRIGELVSDIESMIIQSDSATVHLVGHDWGAQVAWMLAATRPDLISTLTTVSVPHPAAFVASMTQSDQLRRSWYMAAFQPPKLPELMIARKPEIFDKMLAATGMDAAMIADTHRLVVDSGALTGGLNWYRAIPFSTPGAIGRPITVPTTHVWSAGDTALARKGAELAGEHVAADYRLRILEDATHWIPEQNAPELAETILERIRSI
ncbi:alpha/beta fold hydrolase [Gordonia sp. (in: high G+C Gram-positive bacteria)]|uniref:alpha/beta fold hydrolase n=1 Tax=Gordonia sp. (in: high G+C Gram-positive bacteria) TaxID=84139 RepID=UPI00169758D1|nr:alpha/beta fold hydrolase [Gordonia sp. (in: high G+C Gram-positive bacteria)]NLG47916.1 alpha/beta fold hydrolase [Gordonia sp. (in: high G+C Gram-positive bacteria)]